jgi:hypothetical protein
MLRLHGEGLEIDMGQQPAILLKAGCVPTYGLALYSSPRVQSPGLIVVQLSMVDVCQKT